MVLSRGEQRAIERAIEQNVTIEKVNDNEFLASSIYLKPGFFYRVTKDNFGHLTCDCPAGQQNRPCKHAAATAMAIYEEREIEKAKRRAEALRFLDEEF